MDSYAHFRTFPTVPPSPNWQIVRSTRQTVTMSEADEVAAGLLALLRASVRAEGRGVLPAAWRATHLPFFMSITPHTA